MTNMHEQDTLDDDVRFLFEFLSKDEALAAIAKGRALAHGMHSTLALSGDMQTVAAELVAMRAAAMGSLASVAAAVAVMRQHAAGFTH